MSQRVEELMSSQGSSGVRIVSSTEVEEQPSPPKTQTSSPPNPVSLTMAFRAISMVLAAQLQMLLLIINAMAIGWLVVEDPTPMRCYAGAGYSAFVLACMALVKKVR